MPKSTLCVRMYVCNYVYLYVYTCMYDVRHDIQIPFTRYVAINRLYLLFIFIAVNVINYIQLCILLLILHTYVRFPCVKKSKINKPSYY